MKYLILLLTLNAQAKIIDDKVYYPPLGTTADCMYNFTKIEADGARYYMKWIEGEIQYYYTSEGYPYYTVNFKRTLDKMKVDRALNWDIKKWMNHIVAILDKTENLLTNLGNVDIL